MILILYVKISNQKPFLCIFTRLVSLLPFVMFFRRLFQKKFPHRKYVFFFLFSLRAAFRGASTHVCLKRDRPTWLYNVHEMRRLSPRSYISRFHRKISQIVKIMEKLAFRKFIIVLRHIEKISKRNTKIIFYFQLSCRKLKNMNFRTQSSVEIE